jgi:hypothetical protein
MAPNLVHAVLSYGIPLLVGFGIGRFMRTRVEGRYGRINWCLMAIVGSVVLQYFCVLIFSAWMVGGKSDWTGLTPIGLLYGLSSFALVTSVTTVPLTVVGYLCASYLHSRSNPGPPT